MPLECPNCRAIALRRSNGPGVKDQRQGARRALLDAFAELALSRRYQEIGVGLIAGRAAVARSTFYYHFRTKDELLLQNLQPMLSALARLATAAEPTQDVVDWVTHIWEHRVRSRRIFDGATGRKIAEALASELEPALGAPKAGQARSTAPLLADQIAGSMIGLLRAWIAGRATASPPEITTMLWTGATAIAGSNGNDAFQPARPARQV